MDTLENGYLRQQRTGEGEISRDYIGIVESTRTNSVDPRRGAPVNQLRGGTYPFRMHWEILMGQFDFPFEDNRWSPLLIAFTLFVILMIVLRILSHPAIIGHGKR
jgi:hypothetical protein